MLIGHHYPDKGTNKGNSKNAEKGKEMKNSLKLASTKDSASNEALLASKTLAKDTREKLRNKSGLDEQEFANKGQFHANLQVDGTRIEMKITWDPGSKGYVISLPGLYDHPDLIREGIHLKKSIPIGDDPEKAAAMFSFIKKVASSNHTIKGFLHNVTMELQYRQGYSNDTVVNGIEIRIGWISRALLPWEDRGGEHQLYIPDASGTDTIHGYTDGTIDVGEDPKIAKEVFEYATAQAALVKNPSELYKKVLAYTLAERRAA